MKAAFARLSDRERWLTLCGVPVIVLVVLYQFVWLPVNAGRAALTADIASYRLIAANAAAANARPETASTPATDRAPMATRITQSADAAGLLLSRLEPDGDQILVTIDDADFAGMMIWIADLEMDQAIRVAAAEIDRRTEPGIVSARITLEPM